MFFSVIVPTFQRNDLLSLCLSRLAPGMQTLDHQEYEVIVTDDGKVSNAREMIQNDFPWATWIEGPHKGPAANRNKGASKANGKWLVFTDDDCLPDKQMLQSYYEAINQYKEIKVFEGRIYVDRPQQYDDEEAPINESGGYLWSCNFCIEKKLFEVLGGFDEHFPMPAMEDVDFNYRLKKAGFNPSFIYSASVLHPWRRVKFTMGNQLKREASTKLYLSKHPEERTRIGLKFHIDILLKSLKELAKTTFRFQMSYASMHAIRSIYAVRMACWLLVH